MPGVMFNNTLYPLVRLSNHKAHLCNLQHETSVRDETSRASAEGGGGGGGEATRVPGSS